MSGLALYERGAIDAVTWAKHTSLFMFIEELEHGLRPTQTHYDAVFVRTKKGETIAKRRAYEFLQEKGVSDISEHSYFTRGKWCDSILKDTEGNEMMLAEILTNYEKYLENTEWRTLIKEQEEKENIQYQTPKEDEVVVEYKVKRKIRELYASTEQEEIALDRDLILARLAASKRIEESEKQRADEKLKSCEVVNNYKNKYEK